jgi:hypothetical protein
MNTDTTEIDAATLRAIISDSNKLIKRLQRKITAVTEQRDRLAEALQLFLNRVQYNSVFMDGKLRGGTFNYRSSGFDDEVTQAYEALQSLTTNANSEATDEKEKPMKTICKHAYPSDLCGTCNPPCPAVGGDFYNGLEWFACWLLDNKEGETITEELLRPWAYEAWQAHLKKQNKKDQKRKSPASDGSI